MPSAAPRSFWSPSGSDAAIAEGSCGRPSAARTGSMPTPGATRSSPDPTEMNMTTSIPLSHTLRVALFLSALAATSLALVATPHRDQAMAQTRAAAPGFAMAGQQDAYRNVAEEFVAAAARGDKTKTSRMLSPATAARVGQEGVDRFLAGEVLPFFAPFQEFARSVSVTRTADAPGFA